MIYRLNDRRPEGGKNEAFENSGRCGLDCLRRDIHRCRERSAGSGPIYRGANCADPGHASPRSLRRKGLLLAPPPIIGTTVIIGIATIIGTAAIITDITIGGRITVATIITIGIRIIGNCEGEEVNLHKYSERKTAAISPVFLSISNTGIDLKLRPYRSNDCIWPERVLTAGRALEPKDSLTAKLI